MVHRLNYYLDERKVCGGDIMIFWKAGDVYNRIIRPNLYYMAIILLLLY